mmetsp:Transcript_29463/g.54057  ORF Transcript_29463/g.54057 Transcript_29463/m.54057 type:complete len:119 (+) Transcript_29463:91-447(+)
MQSLQENAMLNRWAYCAASLYLHTEIPLVALLKDFANCVQHSAEYQQNTVLYATMPHFRACIYLTGEAQPKDAAERMSYEGNPPLTIFFLFHHAPAVEMSLYYHPPTRNRQNWTGDKP